MASTVDVAQIQQTVGPLIPQANGAVANYLRAGATGETVIGQAHARYHEAVSRGRVYCACSQAAVTWGTALTGTAVTYTLYNPVGSGVNLSLLQTSISQITGSTAGTLVYAANVNPNAAAPATNTSLTVRNAKLDMGGGVAQVYSVTTLPAAPVAIRVLGYAITAAGVGSFTDYVDGAIMVAPNTAITIQGITIVGTGLVSMAWEEVPYL